MTDAANLDQVPMPPVSKPSPPQPAHLRRRRFSLVWLIPLIAAAIAAYLGYRALMQQGPLLTLTFNTGEGLSAGQTQIKYKAVALGTVESIDLSSDNTKVVVTVRMNNIGARFLTTNARFWVVRPRFTPNDLSGLDTLVSGAFIAVDPGAPGGKRQTIFAGLEEPPGVRSDEPGHTFLLKTETIGLLSTGSPVFYRDIQVGEVLGYDIGNGLGPVIVSIFVRSPFDKLVRPQSHFWKSSGVTAQFQNGGFHIEFQSLQAMISGGVTFDVPPAAANSVPSPSNAEFPLYESQDDAASAGYLTKIPIVSYFETSISGLTRGAPVNILGIQVGDVTDVKLVGDPNAGSAKVRVAMELQPERVMQAAQLAKISRPDQALQNMVNRGLRVQLETTSYVTGQKDISLAYVPGAGSAEITHEGDALVLPSQAGGLDNIVTSLSDISGKLSKVPFDKLGDNLNKLLVTANGTLGSAQVKQTLSSLSDTLKNASATLNSVNQSYGDDSDFQRNLEQLMKQANDALRSIKLLSDYLDRHPEALLLGRSGK
jgi:paraquat-inducible protein B